MERSPQDQDKYVVRFPDGMRERLKDEAARNSRSLNAEIIARIERTFGDDDANDPTHIARILHEQREAQTKALADMEQRLLKTLLDTAQQTKK